MSSGQYSVREMLRIHGDGVTRPGTPQRTPPPEPVKKPKPSPPAKTIPHVELLRKVRDIGDKWGKEPYLPENFHKALEEVLGVIGGKDGIPQLKGLRQGYRDIREEATNHQVKEGDEP